MPAALAKMLGIDLSSRKEEKLSSGFWPVCSLANRFNR